MFTVKAEVRSETGQTNYSIFSAERIRVSKYKGGSAPPPPVEPVMEVWLYTPGRDTHEVLYVGNGPDHYCAVYVMNERGKTVDSIYPCPREEALASRRPPRSGSGGHYGAGI